MYRCELEPVEKDFLRSSPTRGLKSAGARFRAAIAAEHPLQVVGAINAYSAMLAERSGFAALYLSGSGVAAASYGLPDLGVTTLEDVLIDVRRITAATSLPLLVDADTGWGNPKRTVREMIKAGAAGIHIEDQVELKRCGHRPNKRLVPAGQMVRRIRSALSGRTDKHFMLVARTDAVAVEGLAAAIGRARLYREAGADMIFAEALTRLDQYREFAMATGLPILANITEFGKTPLYTLKELRSAGVSAALYPLSAFRAMSASALAVYGAIRGDGTQKKVLRRMQTRAELYECLNYQAWERKVDARLRKK